MIRFFKSFQLSVLFFIPVITLLLWLPAFFKDNLLPVSQTGFIDHVVFGIVGSLPNALQVLFAVLLISFEAIYLNLVINRHEVLYKNTYLPALFYVILMSFNNDVICFHPMIFVNLLIIICCNKIFSLFKLENPTSLIFDCGLLFSLISLIYFPAIILFIFFVAALFVIRSFNFREWTIAFIAFILPYFFLAVYGFLTNSLQEVVDDFIAKFSFHGFHVAIHQNLSVLLFVLFFFLILIFSLVQLRSNFYKNSIKTRSAQQVLLIFSFFIIAEIIFVKEVELSHFVQLAIPFSMILSYYYLSAKRRLWLYEISFWVFIALIVQSYL